MSYKNKIHPKILLKKYLSDKNYRLSGTMAILRRQHHRFHCNLQCKANIARSLSFARGWNGVTLLFNPQGKAAKVADASGPWGCGAHTHTTFKWFQLPWPMP